MEVLKKIAQAKKTTNNNPNHEMTAHLDLVCGSVTDKRNSKEMNNHVKSTITTRSKIPTPKRENPLEKLCENK